MANKDPLLSFENFCSPKRNNFDLHFAGQPDEEHWCGDIYRSQAWFTRCMEEHSEEFGALATWLRSRQDNRSPEYLAKLYEAYRMMHPYAEKNWDMFR